MLAQGGAGLQAGGVFGHDGADAGEALRTIYPAQQENIESQDYIEGPKAFAEKRKPNWQNK